MDKGYVFSLLVLISEVVFLAYLFYPQTHFPCPPLYMLAGFGSSDILNSSFLLPEEERKEGDLLGLDLKEVAEFYELIGQMTNDDDEGDEMVRERNGVTYAYTHIHTVRVVSSNGFEEGWKSHV